MDRKSIYTKTAKGLREVTGKTNVLRRRRDLRNVLKEIDGKSGVTELLSRLDGFSEDALRAALLNLINDGYVREFIRSTEYLLSPQRKVAANLGVECLDFTKAGVDSLDFTSVEGESLDFTSKASRASEAASTIGLKWQDEEASRSAKAQRVRQEADMLANLETRTRARLQAEARAHQQAEEKARREAEEQARREAEAKARREAEEKARREAEEKARREAEERARREAEERARREAKEQARRNAEEQARRKAEEMARREAEERARREAEEQARREAEEQARREAEERARREAEEQTRREAEEQARREAEEQARREAEEQARREAEEQARREAEERARREAEEQARREAEEQARREAEERARREAEEQARRKAEEQARREAEEQARREAEEQARRETEERARREADEQARREAEEQARREAEEQARREAEEQARREAEEQARREAEEQARREAKEQARREAEEQARREAEEQARREAEDEARREAETLRMPEAELETWASSAPASSPRLYEMPGKWRRRIAVGLFVLIAAAFGLIHLVPFDEQRSHLEKTAAAQFHQPVTIKALHLSLLPQPHWRLEGIAIGGEGQIKVAQLNAIAALATLFSDSNVFDELEIDTAVLGDEGLSWLLFGKPQQQDLKLARINARNVRLESKHIAMPAFDAKMGVGEDGKWQTIHLEAAEGELRMDLQPMAESVEIDFTAASYRLPFGSALVIKDLQAKGIVRPGELAVTGFSGRLYGGVLRGNSSLKWGSSWTLNGEWSGKQIDAAQLAPGLVEEGNLEGRGLYSFHAEDANKLFANRRLDGNFIIRKGSLRGVDIGNLLKGERGGGRSQFSEIAGSFAVDSGRIQLRRLRLAAGMMSANGDVKVDADKNVRGRFTVDLKSPVVQRSATLVVSGTLKEPRFNRE